MTTYSNSLKLTLIGNGEQSGVWGITTNNNLGTLLEQAITGVQTITMSNSDYTLTNLNGVSDEARNAVLVVNGTNSAIRKVVAPQNQPKTYIVSNQTAGGYAITIGAPTGSTVTIPNGVTAQVYTDGTNFYSSQTGSAGDFTVNGNFAATGSESLTGNLSVGGTLGVTGATTFSTTPTAPTPSPGDNTTKLATTAYVTAAVTGATGSLGTMSTQNANNVNITGGTVNGVTGTAAGLTVGNATNATNSTNATTAATATNALALNGKTKLGLGITGETWQSVGNSQGVTYYAPNYPIQVQGNFGCNGGGNGIIYIDGVQVSFWQAQFNGCGGYSVNMPCIIPANSSYVLTGMGGGARGWYELR